MKNVSQTEPFQGCLEKDVDLSRLNSWRIGGRVKQTYQPSDLDDLSQFLASLPDVEQILFIGLGSNVLFSDGQLDATVILTQGNLDGLSIDETGVICAGAGVTCAKMAKFGARKGMCRAAFFAGVPGTIGGALKMNAGAYGEETWPFVVAVDVIDRHGQIEHLSASEFQYAYRHLEGLKNRWFVAGYFQIPEEGDVEEAKLAIKKLLKMRSDQQPIGSFNCGSVFRNPEGDHAARLIEASGLKGYQVGCAHVSEKHANFMINTGGATASEMRQLIAHVQQVVHAQHGIWLNQEVQIVE